LRILVVSNLYPDARLPAFGTFVAAHVEALRRAGAEVDLLAITGIPAHEAVLRKYAILTLRSVLVGIMARVTGRRPQIVEAHVAYPTAIPASVAAWILGARLVVYSHGSDVTAAGRGFHRRLASRIFRGADLHVATSGFIAGELVRRFHVDERKVIVLSPGIDFDRFSRGGAAEASRSGVLFVGRLASGKGVHELLRAVARLDRPTALRFVGDGPERDTLEREAAEMGIAVSFDGALPPDDVARAMREAFVVAVPSTYPEGLGLVALEGMAAGALVVASEIGGLPESVVNGTTGWLVPPGDVAGLASALSDALALAEAGSSQRTALLRRASDAARAQDVDAIAARTVAAYESLVAP
jgi:glycosyltransferase involved in cell wall biosynthesis